MRSRHFGITDNYIRGSRCHVCRIPRDHEGNCPHQMRETELSKHGMARGLPFCSPWNKKDSPLFSGLDLPQDALLLAMPAVDVLKDFAERRCHKPDDESAVYPAALFEPL